MYDLIKNSCLFCRYARENLALVNVYIKDPAVTQVKRDQKVPLIWFVANIGGILGLTMGMSLVTFFEILHHVIMLFFRTGAKSLATVRRTMTVTSLMRNTHQHPAHHVNSNPQIRDIQNNSHSSIEDVNNVVEIKEMRIQPLNGVSKKQCMTLYVADNSGSTHHVDSIES